MQTASVGKVIERATFDAKWALEDPDLTLLDVGHPLVRRLIEEVKQNAFREVEHYSRTDYIDTPDVEEMTALFHLLARYVVNTEPTSIVEELLPVAVPVYGVVSGRCSMVSIRQSVVKRHGGCGRCDPARRPVPSPRYRRC